MGAEDQGVQHVGLERVYDTDHDDDIIEITEFDEHFPTDDEALLEQAGMLDAAESEKEDFLELIDLAEDKLLEKDLMGLDDSASLLEKDEVNHLISEGLEEELQKKLTEPSFQSEIEDEDQEIDTIKIGVGDALDQDSRTPEDNEEELTGSPNLVSDAADSDSADEKLESDFDPDEILQPGDRLDAFLSEDSSREPALSSSLLDSKKLVVKELRWKSELWTCAAKQMSALLDPTAWV